MKNLAILNPEQVSPEIWQAYPVRQAVRAVVVDDDKKVAVLHVTAFNYHKIPGGGIDPGEDQMTALQRECLEEIGCQIKVLAEVGQITEYRKFESLTQVSYCYLAKVVGTKGLPNLTELELSEGFALEWMSLDAAFSLFQTNQATNIEGKEYIMPRDRIFLNAGTALVTPITK